MQTITLIRCDLFRVAAELLGDATQWIRIAQLNGLTDPFQTGPITLLIPPADPTAGGGIASQ